MVTNPNWLRWWRIFDALFGLWHRIHAEAATSPPRYLHTAAVLIPFRYGANHARRLACQALIAALDAGSTRPPAFGISACVPIAVVILCYGRTGRSSQ